MAQDVIRRGAVEIEVRQDEILQQPLPRELALVGAELDSDVLVPVPSICAGLKVLQ
jgi:hypothetical protein